MRRTEPTSENERVARVLVILSLVVLLLIVFTFRLNKRDYTTTEQIYNVETSVIPNTDSFILGTEGNRYYIYKGSNQYSKVNGDVFLSAKDGSLEKLTNGVTEGFAVGDIIVRTENDRLSFGGYKKAVTNKFIINTGLTALEFDVSERSFKVETKSYVYNFKVNSVSIPENTIDLFLVSLVKK